jgi:hypothetical protein
MPREALVLGLAHKLSFRIRQHVPEDFAYLATALSCEFNQISEEVMVEQGLPGVSASEGM